MNDVNIIENFLTDDECDYVLNKCKNIVLKDINTNYNGCERKQSVGHPIGLEFIKIRLENVLNTTISINGMKPYVKNFQFTEYKIGDLFDWHEDKISNKYRIGVYSNTIQLDDDYVGGKFEIKNLNGEMIPVENKKGSLYMFNPNLLHRITIIESGSRHSLINWVSLVKTNETKQNLI